MKICTLCKTEKELSDYTPHKAYADGLRSWCKPCVSLQSKSYRDRNAGKFEYNYERDKGFKLKKAYGLTYLAYQEMLVAQGHCCAICGLLAGEQKRAFAVDHDHDTGAVRGLLCINCNTGIGNLRDSVELLSKAILYLEKPIGK